MGKETLQECSPKQRNTGGQVELGSSPSKDELVREARQREKMLYQQLQQVQCDHERLKKENQALKHALMNTAQESAEKEDAILRDKEEYNVLRKELENAMRNAQDSRYVAQMERERRIAQVMQLKAQLAKWQRRLCNQPIWFICENARRN